MNKPTQEKQRLADMLETKKITIDEYKLLSSALDKKVSFLNKLFSNLINPFSKIAGSHALILGLIIMLSMSVLGIIANAYFPGILSILNADVIKNPAVSLNVYLLLYQVLTSWIVLTILFIIAAKICRQKNIRLIDFFGTVAFAHYPLLILTIFISIIQLVSPGFMDVDISKGLDLTQTLSLSYASFSIIVISCIIWQIITYFYAFKESSGLIGNKLWFGFIISIIIGFAISTPLTTVFM